MRTALVVTCLFALPALAGRPTVENRDSRSYAYELQCGSSTQNSSISGHNTITLDAKCKLKVKGAGSATLQEGMKCTIKDSSLDCD